MTYASVRSAAEHIARTGKITPQQLAAFSGLDEGLAEAQRQAFTDLWRAEGSPAVSPAYDNTWAGVTAAAKLVGAKYPELVAAQWALESGFGKHVSGRHNYFGLKGKGTTRTTTEFINKARVHVDADFLNFSDLLACVRHLVDKWHLDYKGYKGCNHAPTRNDAAKWLVKEGYATDPAYASKLSALMDKHAPSIAATPTPPPKPVISVAAAQQQQPAKLSPSSPFTARITPNITIGEFALNQESRRFDHQHQLNTAAELAAFLERVRRNFGGLPVIITSGYRPAAINRSVGGASASEHLFNAPGVGAVDFYVKGADINAVQLFCDKYWPCSVGYGAPKGFVHLGIRIGRPRVRWDY
jgi:hypothetical protein